MKLLNHHLLLLFVGFSFGLSTNAQPKRPIGIKDSTTIKENQGVPFRRINISFGLSSTLTSYSSELRKAMVQSNLNDEKWSHGESFDWILFIPIFYRYDNRDQYPIIQRKRSFIDFEISGFINKHHGILFNYTGIESITVKGFEEFGQKESYSDFGGGYSESYWNYGNFISVSMENEAFSLAYVYSLAKQRVNLIIGPSLMPIRISSSTGEKSNLTHFGTLLGGSINLIHKKWWFINVKGYYRWSPAIEIGPYTTSSYEGDIVNTSTFEKVSVSMSSFTVGAGIGLRF